MAERVACPYCNSVIDSVTERTVCPRCSESFITADAEHLPDDVMVSRPQSIATRLDERPTGFLHSRGAMAVSCALAVVILVVGLSLVRPWEPKPKSTSERPLPVVVSPLGLSGLAYLPPSTNMIVAVQPMPLLAYAAISKTDPRKFLIDSGIPEPVFESLSKANISLDQVDHLVFGVSVRDDSLIPGLTVCLKFTRPLADESRFLAQLRAEKNSQQSKFGRTVYSVPLRLPLLMTILDETTVLFGISSDDLAAFEKPHPLGGGHLLKDLRDAMTSRISPASFAWIATDSSTWWEKPAGKFALQIPDWKSKAEQLRPIRALAAGISLEPEPELRLGIRCADAPSTASFQERLRSMGNSELSVIAGDEGWATLRTPFDPNNGNLLSFVTNLLSTK